MAASIPNIKIPFTKIPDISDRAALQIRRNFEELVRNIVPGGSGYDAFIDPSLATSNASTHTYKNITDFTVGEVALLIPTHLTTVFIVGRPGTNVVETSNITLGGPVTFVGGGADSTANFLAGQNRPTIDFAGFSISSTNGWVSFVGLELWNSSVTNIATLVTGRVFLDNCVLNAINLANNRVMSTVASLVLAARNTGFYGNNGFSTAVYVQDCYYQNGTVVTIGSGTGGTFVWDGGSIDPLADLTINFSGNANVYLRAAMNSGNMNGVSSHLPTINITTTGRCYVNLETLTNYAILTIGAAAGDVTVEGTYQQVTISGNTNNNTRTFKGVHAGGIMDITGPCKVDAHITSVVNASQVILRGGGIRADFSLDRPGTDPWLQLIACTESMVVASFFPPGAAGHQAYTIDAASARCLLVTGGTTHANFSVASTNAGTNCTVITELGAPAGPPTGAAGGSLSGTFPNPLFAGRDSSVDQINRDMLPAMLVEASGPMGVQVYGHAVESALAQTTDLSGTWPTMQVTGLAGQKVTAASMSNEDILQYITGFNVGWVNAKPDSVSRNIKEYSKEFLLMGG